MNIYFDNTFIYKVEKIRKHSFDTTVYFKSDHIDLWWWMVSRNKYPFDVRLDDSQTKYKSFSVSSFDETGEVSVTLYHKLNLRQRFNKAFFDLCQYMSIAKSSLR